MNPASLVAYRAFSDTVGKIAFLVITVLAARRLTPEEFGVFALGTTLGWMTAVATDFGMQMHLAREIARRPHAAGNSEKRPRTGHEREKILQARYCRSASFTRSPCDTSSREGPAVATRDSVATWTNGSPRQFSPTK